MSSESAACKAGQCLLDLKQVLSNKLTPQIFAIHNAVKRRLRLRLENFLIWMFLALTVIVTRSRHPHRMAAKLLMSPLP
jgi:hypothetical protein